jgi:hypothetical protein
VTRTVLASATFGTGEEEWYSFIKACKPNINNVGIKHSYRYGWEEYAILYKLMNRNMNYILFDERVTETLGKVLFGFVRENGD